MVGIWEPYGSKREPKGSHKKTILGVPAEWRRPGCLLVSAYKQTYMPAYTAFYVPSQEFNTASLPASRGGAVLSAPRIPPGQGHICKMAFVS